MNNGKVHTRFLEHTFVYMCVFVFFCFYFNLILLWDKIHKICICNCFFFFLSFYFHSKSKIILHCSCVRVACNIGIATGNWLSLLWFIAPQIYIYSKLVVNLFRICYKHIAILNWYSSVLCCISNGLPCLE